MIIASLLAVMLSVPASARIQACTSNEMTSAWDRITFGLWISDYTIPDTAARAADLVYKRCVVAAGADIRVYESLDGTYVLTAATNAGGANGATTLTLSRGGQEVALGTWGHHKVFYKGVGIDKVAVPNGAGGAMIKNVFVIPVAFEKNQP